MTELYYVEREALRYAQLSWNHTVNTAVDYYAQAADFLYRTCRYMREGFPQWQARAFAKRDVFELALHMK